MGKLAFEILVVDDHQMLLDGVRLALSSMPGEPAITTCIRADDALARLKAGQRFDLILLDLNMPGVDGMTFLQTLARRKIRTPVLILSATRHHEKFEQAMAAGAAGFVAKSAAIEELRQAVAAVLNGEQHKPDPGIFRPPLTSGPLSPPRGDQLGLTPRQLEVIELMAEGLPNKLICDRLRISEHTVKKHISAILQKLKVHNRTACVLEATRLGLLKQNG